MNARRETEIKLNDRRDEEARLECRTRPWRERRHPDDALIGARHRVAECQQDLDRLSREICELEASQHRRASHLAQHQADALKLSEIDRVLERHLRAQVNRAVKDPPSYITRTIGPRPAGGEPDRAWVKAVIEVEKYRQDHQITDRRTALGPEPPTRDIFAVHEWRRVGWVIEDARDVLTPQSRPAPAIGGPELGIGL